MTEKELTQAYAQSEAEEKELLKLLNKIDAEIEQTESDRNVLLEKEKGIIEGIRALDNDYSHFKN